MSRPDSRQDLYDRIRKTSRDEVVLDEMIRLGFWKKNEGETSLPEELIRRKSEISKEIREHLKEHRRFSTREAALKEIHRIRKEESRARRQEIKAKREVERAKKAAAWKLRKESEILYLGKGVSASLSDLESDRAQLAKYGLTEFNNHVALAEAMGINLGELKFLTFTRRVSELNHYKRFQMPKKSGGFRLISAPQPRLKNAQYWVYYQILKKLPVQSAAHGFTDEKSILTNAAPHVGSDLVINLDLKDFFPTVNYARVLGMFKGLGYSKGISTVLALLTTEQPSEQIELDGKCLHVAKGERCLPQGAPTSPAITNWLCRRLDARLSGIARKFGFRYTRYADDMTFSASGENTQNQGKLLWHAKKVIHEEGFTLHPEKLRIMHKGQHQEVTGIVVNDKLSVDRAMVRKFRALVHHLESKGLQGAQWQGSDARLLARARGYARFLLMVDKERFLDLFNRMEAISAALGYSHEIRRPAKPKVTEVADENPSLKEKRSTTSAKKETKSGGFISRLIGKLFGS